MNDRIAEVTIHPPAEPALLERALEECGVLLPADYIVFLSGTNGGEGVLSNGAYAALWKAEELRKFNDDYEIPKYCPGFFAFGSNGGGEGYVFYFRSERVCIGQISFIGMKPDDVWIIAETFTAFLAGEWLPRMGPDDK